MINLDLYSYSDGLHLQQIYLGLKMLHSEGLIKYRLIALSKSKNLDLRRKRALRIIVNHKIRIFYDMNDGDAILLPELYENDYYIKRSYSLRGYDSIDENFKIHPYGLNMEIYSNGVDVEGLKRSLYLLKFRFPSFIGHSSRYLDMGGSFSNYPRPRTFEDHQLVPLSPRAIFVCKAYDPYNKPNRSSETIADWLALNEFRASCIRGLKKEFGKNVYAGFQFSDYAKKCYPNLTLDRKATTRKEYFKTLVNFGICIANRGLQGSNGHKLPEYVSFGRAVVVEELQHKIPYGFNSGVNYLEYKSVDQCIENVAHLMDQPIIREQIAHNNINYYWKYLRPDKIVYHSLVTAGIQIGNV